MLERITDYGRLYTAQRFLTSTSEAAGQLKMMAGADGTVIPDNTASRFILPLWCGLQGCESLLPLKFCPLTFELELCQNYADALDGTTQNQWNLEDCRLLVDMVQAHSDVVESLFGALAKGSSLNLRIPSVHSFSQTVQNLSLIHI